MISDSEKKSIIDKIIKSKEFHNADKYIDLLHYLIDTTLKGYTPKEKEIAQKVLQRGEDFDPYIDTSVRVYMYRLRKKLEDYYQNEGKQDDIHVIIPKGEYYVEFKNSSPQQIKSTQKRFNKPVIFLTVLLIISFGIIMYMWAQFNSYNNTYNYISEYQEIWGPFLNNGKPTLIVLGDHFFFASRKNNDYETDKHIRFHKVNTTKDLEKFIAQNKNPDIQYFKDTDYFLDRYCTWSLLDILPIFYCCQKKVELRIASEITWNDFQEYNMIFIGSYKTLGIMESLFTNLHIQYELFPLPNKIIVRDTVNKLDTCKTFISRKPPMFQREYSSIAKVPGPNNNTILLLCGFNYIGVENSVKMVTDVNHLSKCKKDLKKTFNEIPAFFEMVYQVEGFERTSMYSNFLYSFQISNDYYISQDEFNVHEQSVK